MAASPPSSSPASGGSFLAEVIVVFFSLAAIGLIGYLGYLQLRGPQPAPPAPTPTAESGAAASPLIPVTGSTPPAAPGSTPTGIPTQTPAPTFTVTPVWPVQGPGAIVCPILLYHRVAVPAAPSDYYVTPGEFRAQMQALSDWGYTPIPISLLVRAITEGAPLPERPVVITFDDGDITVYTAAFPIMQEFGFTGVAYVVANRLQVEGHMNPEQLKELSAAGWEIGSHSMTHSDLRQSGDLDWEVRQSRLELQAALGVPVETFAYPILVDEADRALVDKVRLNYAAAVGLGPAAVQDRNKLYYLWRRPVLSGWDAARFGSYLPWSAPPSDP
jgi:peptidoglycan/xylan/chitin deacetylase (PgdA/CDA1 family)